MAHGADALAGHATQGLLRPVVTHLRPGEPAPWFLAATVGNPQFDFSSLGGQFVLLAFVPTSDPARGKTLARLAAHQTLFNDDHLTVLAVLGDPAVLGQVRDQRGLRWINDLQGDVARLFGVLEPNGERGSCLLLLDPRLRVLAVSPAGGDTAEEEAFFQRLASLPPLTPEAFKATPTPVLLVSRVFDPDLCRRLIETYETVGGRASGVMRDIDGHTVAVMDDMKRRRDVLVDAPEMRNEIRDALRRRLVPEIRKAFQFEATRIERFVVSCYDAAEGGMFRAHRDNTTLGTAHRRFAVSINLNAEAFEGGDLRFPEFGRRTWRPPTGGAAVFSCSLLHEAMPVTAGRRYAFLPFLYDEAAARVREDNRGFRHAGGEGAAGLVGQTDDRLSPEGGQAQ